MTTKIYSKVEPDKILLSMIRFDEIKDVRNDISPDEEFISADPLEITSEGLQALQEAVIAANRQSSVGGHEKR